MLFAAAAFVLPWLAARASGRAGSGLASGAGELRIAALDALTGCGKCGRSAAEGRMLAAGAGAGSDDAVGAAGDGRAHGAGEGGVFPVRAGRGPGGLAGMPGPILRPRSRAFLVLGAFEAIGGRRAPGRSAGHARRRRAGAGSGRCAGVGARSGRSAVVPVGTVCGSRAIKSAGSPTGHRCSTA